MDLWVFGSVGAVVFLAVVIFCCVIIALAPLCAECFVFLWSCVQQAIEEIQAVRKDHHDD